MKMWESRMSTSAFPREPDRAKLALGQLASRREDPGPLIGDGKHADDINCDGQAYAAVVRSEAAHGILRGIDTNVARGMPGVLGIWTGADLKSAGHGPLRELILARISHGVEWRGRCDELLRLWRRGWEARRVFGIIRTSLSARGGAVLAVVMWAVRCLARVSARHRVPPGLLPTRGARDGRRSWRS